LLDNSNENRKYDFSKYREETGKGCRERENDRS